MLVAFCSLFSVVLLAFHIEKRKMASIILWRSTPGKCLFGGSCVIPRPAFFSVLLKLLVKAFFCLFKGPTGSTFDFLFLCL